MDFSYTEKHEALRVEVRQFLKENPPENFSQEIEDEGYGLGGWSNSFALEVGKKGWLSYPWPEEYGGLNGSLFDWWVIKDEMGYNRAPNFATLFNDSVGLSILGHGTEDQRRKFLPKLAKGEYIFCTALSEPNAGCDLFSLKTFAEEKDGKFIINGQKIWSTGAHVSNWALAVVRTDRNAPGHKGLSTILLDMKTPGITVRPIIDMTDSESFCEIFFEDVVVPKENLLGEKNKGLKLIMETLEGDRFWGRCVKYGGVKRTLEELISYVKDMNLNKDPAIRMMLADMTVELKICLMYTLWVIGLIDQGKELSYEACILKTFADEFGHRFCDSAMKILGLNQVFKDNSKWSDLKRRINREYLFSFGALIAGGTTEMQRMTVASRGLGLSRI